MGENKQPATLEQLTAQFTAELTELFVGVIGPKAPKFTIEKSSSGKKESFFIRPKGKTIFLNINGEHTLTLDCSYRCVWDREEKFLKIAKSKIHILSVMDATPLFRYEFLDTSNINIPSAHIHLHVHRDEYIYPMVRAIFGKPAMRAMAIATGEGKQPRVADIHFPVGYQIYPGIEDILQLLITEFGIDTASGAQNAISKGRERWRCRQLACFVRDEPEACLQALQDIGYIFTRKGSKPTN